MKKHYVSDTGWLLLSLVPGLFLPRAEYWAGYWRLEGEPAVRAAHRPCHLGVQAANGSALLFSWGYYKEVVTGRRNKEKRDKKQEVSRRD